MGLFNKDTVELDAWVLHEVIENSVAKDGSRLSCRDEESALPCLGVRKCATSGALLWTPIVRGTIKPTPGLCLTWGKKAGSPQLSTMRGRTCCSTRKVRQTGSHHRWYT